MSRERPESIAEIDHNAAYWSDGGVPDCRHHGITEHCPKPERRYWYDRDGIRHIGCYVGSLSMRSDIDGIMSALADVANVSPCPTLAEWQTVQKLNAEMLAMLERLQYVRFHHWGGLSCAVCRCDEEDGCAADCELSALIKKASD